MNNQNLGNTLQYITKLEQVTKKEIGNMISEWESLKEFGKSLDKRIEHLKSSIDSARSQCPHDWRYVATNPNNGNEGYQCHFCGDFKAE